MNSTRRSWWTRALFALTLLCGAAPAARAQWSTVHEQSYLPASHNWAFRQNYAFADLLFNAFDYGHAILYETLYTRTGADPSLLEGRIYDHLTRRVLVRPPHVPLEESAVMVQYAKLVPEAKMMFDWAHVLHRQAYDVWADERIPIEQKDARMAEILAYYRSRSDIAFSTRPKSMDLMDGQYYSLAFREAYPKFNGLIWAYHWLQIGLYEPLLAAPDADGRQALAQATVARFWQMLENPPETMPYLMPMTAAIAPLFAQRYPEMAIVFDNLHMMHDVVSDILASPAVPRSRKRAEILRAIDLFRDDTSHVTTVDEWRQMALGMGIENQGGPAIGLLGAHAQPTVPRGMSMAGMQHTAPAGTGVAADPHAAHGAEPAEQSQVSPEPQPQAAARPHMPELMQLLILLVEAPEIRTYILRDPDLRALWANPALQAELDEMRSMHAPAGAGTAPAPTVTPADGGQHQH